MSREKSEFLTNIIGYHMEREDNDMVALRRALSDYRYAYYPHTLPEGEVVVGKTVGQRKAEVEMGVREVLARATSE